MVARLDRTEGGRELARLAAVLGRESGHEVLAAVATLDEPTLQAELTQLARAEILGGSDRAGRRLLAQGRAAVAGPASVAVARPQPPDDVGG